MFLFVCLFCGLFICCCFFINIIIFLLLLFYFLGRIFLLCLGKYKVSALSYLLLFWSLKIINKIIKIINK